MELKDAKGWQASLDANAGEPYGECGLQYTEAWANLMEERMANGATLESIAEQASHDADTEGITGFMFGCAVSLLAQVWVHGEQLRRWHNLEIQLKDEGEVANKSGATLNPALLRVGEE